MICIQWERFRVQLRIDIVYKFKEMMTKKINVIKLFVLFFTLLAIACNSDNKIKTNESPTDVNSKLDENKIPEKLILFFEQQFGSDENQKSNYTLTFNGTRVEISYKFASENPYVEIGEFQNGKIITEECSDCYVLRENSLCIPNPNSDAGEDCYQFIRNKSTHNIDEALKSIEETSENVSNKKEENIYYDYFEGQKINEGERVIKLTWDNKTQTALWNVRRDGTFNNTMGIKIKRHCSNLVTVPQGKKWIVLYGIINYKFNANDKMKTVYGPEIKIDNGRTLEPWYLEKHDKGISFAEAKDTKLKIYSGSTIRGFITPEYERAEYSNAEVYFLETNE